MKYFEPLTLPSGERLRNRLVVAAMTNQQSEADGCLHERERVWLEARAKGGFGNVTTCAAHVSLDGQGWTGELGVFDDKHLPGLTHLAETLTHHQASAWVQLFHGGVRAPSKVTGQQPWSATAFDLNQTGVEIPRAATEEDIQRTIQNFAAAAKRCEAAGFTGVELHGAHGYLLCQFMGRTTNTRTDRWGGSLEGRAAFPLAVYDAVRQATSSTFTVGIRLSPFIRGQGLVLEDSLAIATMFAERGADFVHASLWDSFEPHPEHPTTSLTTMFRQTIVPSCPLIVTGNIWTPADALQIMDEGADLIGMGRAAIGNPDWPLQATSLSYEPERPPYTAANLKSKALSDIFVDYMRRWKNFVADEEAP